MERDGGWVGGWVGGEGRWVGKLGAGGLVIGRERVVG